MYYIIFYDYLGMAKQKILSNCCYNLFSSLIYIKAASIHLHHKNKLDIQDEIVSTQECSHRILVLGCCYTSIIQLAKRTMLI